MSEEQRCIYCGKPATHAASVIARSTPARRHMGGSLPTYERVGGNVLVCHEHLAFLAVFVWALEGTRREVHHPAEG